MVLLESKYKPIIKYIVLVTVAVFMHKSAFAAFSLLPFLWIRNIKLASVLIALMSVGGIAVRSTVLSYIKLVFMKDSLNPDANLYFGGNLVFLLALATLFVLVEVTREKNTRKKLKPPNKAYKMYNAIVNHNHNRDGVILNYDYQNVFARSFLLSIFFMVLFGMDTSARSYMILNQVIIISLPNTLEQFEEKLRHFIIVGVVAFMLMFFYTNSIVPNNFDIIPYQFFWKN